MRLDVDASDAGTAGWGDGGPRRWVAAVLLISVLGLLVAACGSGVPAAGTDSAAGTPRTAVMTEYVAGHWVPFTAAGRRPLTAAQWAVVDAYARFSAAALAVYRDRSVDPLSTVISASSTVTGMFRRDLASGKNPEALYTKAVVESVAISGCRATLTLELSYLSGRRLHYVSSWVRPFDKAAFSRGKRHTAGAPAAHGGNLASAVTGQYAPWLFVGDNRVGGASTPCGI